MEFRNLTIENFMTIGPAQKIWLDNRGLVLVQGQNLDDSSANSNGVGKSTLVDALCWAIYGKTAREETGDGIVNDIVKKNCAVRVELVDGATEYVVTRHRKHSKFKNQTVLAVIENGAEKDISKGTEAETQQQIEAIVGSSYSVFKSSVYSGQEDMPDLPKMTDKNLKMLIEEAAGVERLEAAYKVASAEALDVEKQIDTAVAALDVKKGNRGHYENLLAQATANFNNFEAARQVKSDESKAMAMKYAAEVKVADGQLAKLDAEKLATEKAELLAKLAETQSEKEGLAKLQKERDAAQVAYAKSQSEYNTQETTTRNLKYRFENAEEAMKKPCGECGKTHTPDEVDEYKAHAKANLHTGLLALRGLSQSVQTDKLALDKAAAAIATYQGAMTDTSAVSLRLTEIDGIERAAASIKKNRDASLLNAQQHATNAKVVLTEANPHASSVEARKQDIVKLEDAIKADEARIEEMREKAEIAIAAKAVFGPAGVRAHILDTVTPFLNAQTSNYLSVLSDGNITATWTTLTKSATGDLKEKFSIEVTHAKGGKSFGLISGGEKRKVRLACMLALQDLVASRATKPINLFIGDEIDDALDVAGLERLMTILERKARERGTVLVVSHNDLSDWADNLVTVTKQGGFSRVEGALSDES